MSSTHPHTAWYNLTEQPTNTARGQLSVHSFENTYIQGTWNKINATTLKAKDEYYLILQFQRIKKIKRSLRSKTPSHAFVVHRGLS